MSLIRDSLVSPDRCIIDRAQCDASSSIYSPWIQHYADFCLDCRYSKTFNAWRGLNWERQCLNWKKNKWLNQQTVLLCIRPWVDSAELSTDIWKPFCFSEVFFFPMLLLTSTVEASWRGLEEAESRVFQLDPDQKHCICIVNYWNSYRPWHLPAGHAKTVTGGLGGGGSKSLEGVGYARVMMKTRMISV